MQYHIIFNNYVLWYFPSNKADLSLSPISPLASTT